MNKQSRVTGGSRLFKPSSDKPLVRTMPETFPAVLVCAFRHFAVIKKCFGKVRHPMSVSDGSAMALSV